MEALAAGELRHPVTIQSKTLGAAGDRGQPSVTWTTEASVRAQIEELSGRKLELARQLVATATHRVVIRYLSSLAVTDRVVFGSRVFNIGHILNWKLLNFTQELICTEQVSGAL